MVGGMQSKMACVGSIHTHVGLRQLQSRAKPCASGSDRVPEDEEIGELPIMGETAASGYHMPCSKGTIFQAIYARHPGQSAGDIAAQASCDAPQSSKIFFRSFSHASFEEARLFQLCSPDRSMFVLRGRRMVLAVRAMLHHRPSGAISGGPLIDDASFAGLRYQSQVFDINTVSQSNPVLPWM